MLIFLIFILATFIKGNKKLPASDSPFGLPIALSSYDLRRCSDGELSPAKVFSAMPLNRV